MNSCDSVLLVIYLLFHLMFFYFQIHIGDEIDRVLGFSPDTNKYILVDRIIVKGVDQITNSGMYPVKLEVLKKLTVENYEDPWDPATLGELNN